MYRTAFVALADLKGHLVSFYQAFLGKPPNANIPGVYAEFDLQGLRLGIFRPKSDHQAEFMGRSGGMSLCLEVVQLETAIIAFQQAGVAIGVEVAIGEITTAFHGREVYAIDPGGNRVILHEAA